MHSGCPRGLSVQVRRTLCLQGFRAGEKAPRGYREGGDPTPAARNRYSLRPQPRRLGACRVAAPRSLHMVRGARTRVYPRATRARMRGRPGQTARTKKFRPLFAPAPYRADSGPPWLALSRCRELPKNHGWLKSEGSRRRKSGRAVSEANATASVTANVALAVSVASERWREILDPLSRSRQFRRLLS